MTRALIDGDVLAYSFGSLTKRPGSPPNFCPELSVGDPLPFAVCWASLQKLIEDIKVKTKCEDATIFLSSTTHPTWRYDIATIQPYKGNRGGKDKPHQWANIRANFPIHYDCIVAEGIEADDAMGMAQMLSHNYPLVNNPTVICTPDKDLSMIPGWHYSWATGTRKEIPLWYQDELGALKCFYKQLLTGDDTDNILGLYGMGPKSTALAKVDACTNEDQMVQIVFREYERRFGSYAMKFMTETGQLLWIQREPDQRWEVPVPGEGWNAQEDRPTS